ncbi:O-antigen transporter RfbX [Deinococcus grandis]|uniref:O-antigen transporter RfbX n=1 Tax=Deinococcus grandis TaxID=57498 RepID=A0A100HIY6_9DEIO|nr:O-antigen transporter RfbX [Deinococcus grandis]GAQ20254.1 O-antigen transporter RfbX [Deinococcus grandis]
MIAKLSFGKIYRIFLIYLSFFLRGFSFLIIAPYATKLIPPDYWGAVLSAQALGLWVTLILDYGFNVTATRNLVSLLSNKLSISSAISGIYTAKLVLLIPSIIVVVLGVYFSSLKNYTVLSLFIVFWAAAQSFGPVWYFQAIDRLHIYALTDIFSRLLYILLIFIFLRSPEDYYLIIVLQFLTILISTIVQCVIMSLDIGPEIFKVSLVDGINALRSGWSISIFTIITSIYTAAGIFILGIFVPSHQVAVYGNADRLARAGLSMFGPINQIIVPRIYSLMHQGFREGVKYIYRVSAFYFPVAVLIFFLIILLAKPAITILFGDSYIESVNILRLLGLLFPIIALNTILSSFILIPLGKDNYVTVVYSIASALSLGAMIILIPHMGIVGMAYSVIIPEAFASISLGFQVYKILRRNRAES